MNFNSLPEDILSRIQIETEAKIAATVQYHVCGNSPHIPGSLLAQCCHCGRNIYYCDLVSANIRKICFECVQKTPEFKHADFLITPHGPFAQHKGN